MLFLSMECWIRFGRVPYFRLVEYEERVIGGMLFVRFFICNELKYDGCVVFVDI